MASPLLSNATKDEIFENMEIFAGGSMTAVASEYINKWLVAMSSPVMSDTLIRALTGGLSSLVFVLMMHLMHMIFAGADHNSGDKEVIGSNSASSVTGARPQPQGSCCPGCSVSYCNAINQQKKRKALKKVKAVDEREFSMFPFDEANLNSKGISSKTGKITGCDPTFMYCGFIDESSMPNLMNLPTLPQKKSNNRFGSRHNFKNRKGKGSDLKVVEGEILAAEQPIVQADISSKASTVGGKSRSAAVSESIEAIIK